MKRLNIPKYLQILLALTILNLLVLMIRNLWVGNAVFDFLKSNLFSGILPLVIAVILKEIFPKINNTWFILGSLVWLLFYPNSPYMISDLIHNSSDPFRNIHEEIIVHDTLIIFSIAILSAFYGFVSLKIMFNLFRERWGSKFAHSAIFFSLALSCLGFFMGRTLRAGNHQGNLYSWDFLLHPGKVIREVWEALFPIGDHLPNYAMMILFGIVQYTLLIMMKDIQDIEAAQIITKD